MHAYVCVLFILPCVGTKTKDSILKYSSSVSAIQPAVPFLSASPRKHKCFPRVTLRQENHLHSHSHTHSISPRSCPSFTLPPSLSWVPYRCGYCWASRVRLQTGCLGTLCVCVCVCVCECMSRSVCEWKCVFLCFFLCIYVRVCACVETA